MYRHHRHRHTLLAALTVYNTEIYNTLLLATVVIVMHSNKRWMFCWRLSTICRLLNYPDGIFIIAGDFNQANLKTVLPKFRVAK